jgi:Putative prokaryotic signal transducing protein
VPPACSIVGRLQAAKQCRAANDDGAEALRELVRTNDAVVVSAIEALLKGAGISHMIADQNISTIEPIGIFPRRILVDEDQLAAARRLLTDAGFANELRSDKG